MEIVNRRVKREKKFPRVPIKTYKWEDVRRSRRRGGYPWTHLYKEPFYEHLDPEPWTMDGMRNAKSSSTMGKSEDFSISEVSTFDNRSANESNLDNPSLDIKDKNHSIKTSCSSLNLEEQEIEDDVEGTYEIIDKEEVEIENPSPGMFFLHSEESSDDISQYLDKEERGPLDKPDKGNHKQEDRLKPEDESSGRKRKLSAESSNSKLNIGKQAIIQKLKEARDKIKVPKITFPTKLKKPIPKKTKNSPPETRKTVQKSPLKEKKEVKPVYIHIPLKPPPGETDSFSHLEHETVDTKPPVKKPASFKDLVKNIKHLQEPQIEHKHPSPIRELKEDEVEDITNKELVEDTVKKLTADDKPINKDIEEKSSPEQIKPVIQEDLPDIMMQETNEDSKDKESDESMEIVEVIDTDAEGQSEEKAEESLPPGNEFFDELFKASASTPRTNSQNESRKVRSKSAEPERKRKLSLESSYSRKSLSKLGFLKKLREAKDKIKTTLSRSTSKKEIKKEEIVKPVEKPKAPRKPQKEVVPVYIHIPLKPPEGQTDQYSHLEHEPRSAAPEISPAQTETLETPGTPESPLPANGDVQLIILTAPSDDEVLDYNSSDVPETPVSETKLFFPVKIHELKELAKGAVDEVTTTSTSNKLAPVTEEQGSTKSSTEDISKEVLEEQQKLENMMIDEEDGLNETKKQETITEEIQVAVKTVAKLSEELDHKLDETIDAKESLEEKNDNVEEEKKEEKNEELETSTVNVLPTEEKTVMDGEEPQNRIVEAEQTLDEKVELKSSLRSPNSPIMRKKVSFKRKSKSKSVEAQSLDSEVDKESDKEQQNGTKDKTEEMEVENVNDIKDETNMKWSKISDHDHDTGHLSPPNNIEIPTTMILNNTPAVIISTSEAFGGQEQPYDFSAKHVYEEISEGPSKKSPTTQRVVFSATTDSRSSETSEKPKEGPSKFQMAFKQKADNFKTRLQNMKRPHISLPERPKIQKPNLQKFKVEKPSWNMPKFPDTAKIHLPKFNLHRKSGGKKSVKRISSTESTSGDSKKPLFDFGTYPRIFKRKSKPDIQSDFATVPRTRKTDSSKSTEDSRDSRRSATDSMRIPLHSEDSTDKNEINVPADSSDLIEPSHIRYGEGIDSEDEFDKENRELMEEREFLSRWQRGRFNPEDFMEERRPQRITDLDVPEERYELSSNNGRGQHYSSGSSEGVHRQGVIEEINPDEFFLRQKGISQDNIEVGMYLSTEIREAFRNPTNALLQMEDNNFDKGSHQSLPEIQNKRKPIKKPKRKKTPHASHERIPYGGEEETADEDIGVPPPSRPKRRSKRKKKNNEEFVPYQETIQADQGEDRLAQHRESLGILADDEQEFMYENDMMEGIEQPSILLTDPYRDYGEDELEIEEEPMEEIIPEAPPRKPKVIKSLRTFETGSAIQTFDKVKTIPSHQRVPERISYHTKTFEKVEPEDLSYELNIAEPETVLTQDEENQFEMEANNSDNFRYMDESHEELLPAAPPRKHKSLKSLTLSENESFPGDLTANRAIFSSEKNLEEPQIEAIRTESKIIIPIEPEISPVRPFRSRSRPNSKSRTTSRATSRDGSDSKPTSCQDLDSLSLHADFIVGENPETAVPCVEEPCVQTICDYMGYSTVDRNKPRDPPLPPPRTLQRKKKPKKNDENKFFTVPRRKASVEDLPTRPIRIYSTVGPGQKSPQTQIENKENLEVDIMQYIEQDPRDLESGEVLEKIKARPLPAPPRPPRKTRPLSDITSRENIMIDSNLPLQKASTGEIEVYTQTEPLPDDFVCEEVVQEPTDRIIIPTQAAEQTRIKRCLITPTVFTHEETITHGSLLVEPLNGAKLLPDSDITRRSNERITPVHVESDIEETSSIPEEFHQLSDPVDTKQKLPHQMDVLKAQKLQVADLDVDTLTVNKLLASKIVVSEIDSSSIQTNEISSKTGTLKVGDISLPPEILEQIIKTIQAKEAAEEIEKSKEVISEQKKTPIEVSPDLETSILVPLEKYLAQAETSDEERLSEPSLSDTPVAEDKYSLVAPEDLVSKEATVQHPVMEDKEIPLLSLEDSHSINIASSAVEYSITDDKEVPVLPLEAAHSIDAAESSIIENVKILQLPSEDLVAQDVPLQYPVTEDKEVPVLTLENSRIVETSAAENVEILPLPSENLASKDVSSQPVLIENPPEKPPRKESTPEKTCSVETENAVRHIELDVEESPQERVPPHRPPRQSERLKASQTLAEMSWQEPEVDDEPPPRPPHPPVGYIPSQPPSSFYALKAQKYVDDNIPVVPRRKRHSKSKRVSRSTSEESSDLSPVVRRHHRRSSDPSIAHLSGQLVRACGTEANEALKRLITYILNNVFHNEDGKQDLNVMIIIVLVLIAGLLLLGYGEERTVVHLHHWEYFNPPKNL